MNDREKERSISNEKESVTFSASIHDVIGGQEIEEIYQVILNGFIDTNQNSILRQSMTKEEFDNECSDTQTKKVTLSRTENGQTVIIGYASIIVGQENMPWLDIQKMVDVKKIPKESDSVLCSIGTIVILPEYRSYESIEELLKVLGNYLSNLNIQTIGEGKEFGVVFDCAPTNVELSTLVDHLLNKHLGPTKVEKIGYTTALFIKSNHSSVSSSVARKTNNDGNDSIFTSHFLENNAIDSNDIEILHLDPPINTTYINQLIHDTVSGNRKKSVLIKVSYTTESIKNIFETPENIHIEEQTIWLSNRKL